MARFSEVQIRRYSRQILLREVGGGGQTRLGAARPVLFCAGEVGWIAAEYLWRAGVVAPELLAATVDEAAGLTAQLTAAGYPGAPARAISAAAETLQRVVQAAPGFTLFWLPGVDAKDAVGGEARLESTLLWAGCQGSWGGIGGGISSLHKTAAERPGGAAVAGASGAGAMIVGSGLALLAMQRTLGTSEPRLAADTVWQIELAGSELPAWR